MLHHKHKSYFNDIIYIYICIYMIMQQDLTILVQSLGSENTKQLDCNLTLTMKVGASYHYEFLTQSAMARIEMLLTY